MRRVVCAVVLLSVPRAALACPVCFGQSDSPLASATNMGILFLLGIVSAVLGSFGAFIVHLNRRGRLVAAEGMPATAGHLKTSASAPQEGIAQC
jgi:hypothetical protein